MKCSIKKGLGFGLTSGIITTLGLIIGLHSSTNSKSVVIGGIIVIAIADALSDALGVHISEEASAQISDGEIWEATLSTFVSKFLTASLFLIPLLLWELQTAIVVSIVFGLSLIALFSYYLAKQQKIKPLHVIVEHVAITILVILTTHYIGTFVSNIG